VRTTARWPKPKKRDKKKQTFVRRGARPTSRMPDALGDYRARVKYADDLWRKLIRAKEPEGRCARCRQRPWVDAAHLFIKGRYAHLRHDPSNGAPLCRYCHRVIDSDHHAKESFFRPYVGHEEYERLRLAAQSGGKRDMILVILSLEQEVEKLESP